MEDDGYDPERFAKFIAFYELACERGLSGRPYVYDEDAEEYRIMGDRGSLRPKLRLIKGGRSED